MRPIPIGAKGSFSLLVAPQHLANQFKDERLPPVLATPIGHLAHAEAEVTKVAGRLIEFTVSARDETEEIGNGTHERMVIDVKRLGERLAKKGKG
jgi:predicted thioesterase